LRVLHQGQSFKVALKRRPTAKRITLRVSNATGEVVLTIPERTEVGLAQRFADSHSHWIATRIARVPQRVLFEAGSLVPLRGVPHRIVHWSTIRGVTQAGRGSTGEPIIAVAGEAAHVARRVRDFLEAEAKRDFAAAVKRHTLQLGVAAKRITVRDTKSRWGSCSAGGALNFSWRLIMAPPLRAGLSRRPRGGAPARAQPLPPLLEAHPPALPAHGRGGSLAQDLRQRPAPDRVRGRFRSSARSLSSVQAEASEGAAIIGARDSRPVSA
jgi:predicted metal-dependent hydrolase